MWVLEREGEAVGEKHTCENWRESGRGLERYTHVGTGERVGGGWRESGRGLERYTHVRTGERVGGGWRDTHM